MEAPVMQRAALMRFSNRDISLKASVRDEGYTKANIPAKIDPTDKRIKMVEFSSQART